MLVRAGGPRACCCGSERCVGILTFLLGAPALAPFSLGSLCTPPPHFSRDLQFSSPLFGPVVVLLGNSNAGKRSGLLVVAPPALGSWRPRPRAAVVVAALRLGYLRVSQGGRLEEAQGVCVCFLFLWRVRVVSDLHVGYSFGM